MADLKLACPCCGCLTLESEGSYDICPVCFWEDDPTQRQDASLAGGANTVSLAQARQNYEATGACEARFQEDVRRPMPEEVP